MDSDEKSGNAERDASGSTFESQEFDVVERGSLGYFQHPDLAHHFLLGQRVKSMYSGTDETTWEATKRACQTQILFAPKALKAFRIGNAREAREWEEYVADGWNEGSPLGDDYIAPGLPGHTGYTRMCMILFREKNYTGVIEYALRAQKEGWGGDWDRRIARAEIALTRQQKMVSAPGKRGNRST